MIDFRYHLVSLISVFLALAIGIVLGAGPLRESIGESLSGQVDKLRADRNQLSSENASLRQTLSNQQTYLNDASSHILANKLRNQKIALVFFTSTQKTDLSTVQELITKAGGELVSQVKIGQNWTSLDKTKYREALSGQVTQYLPEQAPSLDFEETLALSLSHLLTHPQSETIKGILTSGESPLLEKLEIGEQADAILVIGEPENKQGKTASNNKNSNGDKGDSDFIVKQQIKMVSGIAFGGTPTVIWGDADEKTDLIAQLRNEQSTFSTVDGIGTASGGISTVLALYNAIAGTTGNWGFGLGASETMPPVDTVQEQPKTPNTITGEQPSQPQS